jgi:hypothetical protein
MRAKNAGPHRFHIRSRLGIARGPRRGIALMWALIGITIVALMSAAAMHLARGERMVNDNFDSGRRALYLADQALSQFYADFKPTTNLSIPVVSTMVDDAAEADEETEDPGETEEVEGTYEGADLKTQNMTFGKGNAVVTPYKIVESQFGDVYLLESSAAVFDDRADHPPALRTLRTYASLLPPFKLRGALTAPGGVRLKDPDTKHFHVDGGKKGKCGSGISVPALVAPEGTARVLKDDGSLSTLKGKKVHIKFGADGVGVDSTTANYQELLDSLHVDFAAMKQDVFYSGTHNFIDIPRDYPTLNAMAGSPVFANAMRAQLWPIVLVHGNVNLTSSVRGFGMLIVDGKLDIVNKLDWRGVILTGKGLEVKGSGHLHSHGAVAAGLDCTPAQATSGDCLVSLTGSHLGVVYAQCEAEAAWGQLLMLRPLTPSRHTPLD